jgi:hypothetical protein
MHGSLLTNRCWRRQPSSTAASHGWGRGECGTQLPTCLDHADQGVHAAPCARAADQRAALTTIQRQGCIAARWRCPCRATAAPRIPQHGSRPDNVAGSGRRTRPGSPCTRGTARLRPWWRRIGSITRRSSTVHAGQPARSSVDHPPFGATAAARGERRNIKRPPSGAGVLAAPIPRTRMGPLSVAMTKVPAGGMPAPTPLDRLQHSVNRATAPTANPYRSTAAARRSPGSRTASVGPSVRVAAPAGPAPPPATGGRPQARPASA